MADEIQTEVKRNTVLTDVGRNLMAKCITGNTLKISKVVLGDGDVPAAVQDLREMTVVISPKMTLPVVYRRIDGTGTAILDCELKNTELEHGFFAKEIGVFATDPETGDEVLYAYRNTGARSDYITAASSTEIINQIYSIIIVVDQIENVEVTITEGVGSVSRAEYYEHLSSTNPHPEFAQISDTKVTNTFNIWVNNGEKRQFERMSVSDMRSLVLGGDTASIPYLEGRISQNEQEILNLAFRQNASSKVIYSSTEPINPAATWVYNENFPSSAESELFNILDLSNMIYYNDFSADTSEIDTLKVKVNAITAGARAIGVDTLDGIHQGMICQISDGENSEIIEVKSLSKNGNILRIMVKEDILNTYDISKTYIYRTTAGHTKTLIYSDMRAGEELVGKYHEFKKDGIKKLAYSQAMIRHGKLDGVNIKAFVNFNDEIIHVDKKLIGTGTGSKQTIPIDETTKIDYSTVELFANGEKISNVDVNTETNPAEVTFTAPRGANIAVSYAANFETENWQEMKKVAVEEYENAGITASRFEFALPLEGAEKTRTAVKWTLEGEGSAKIYGVGFGWAKVKETEAV